MKKKAKSDAKLNADGTITLPREMEIALDLLMHAKQAKDVGDRILYREAADADDMSVLTWHLGKIVDLADESYRATV